jgi:hypothetical protein
MQILQNLLSSKTPFESPFVDIARDIPTLSRPPPDVAAEPFAIVAASTLSIPPPAKAKYTATSTLKLFPDDTVPASDDPSGYQLLSLVRDMMTNFQSNRHEGAKFLLELNNGLWITGHGKWFKDKGKDADEMGRDLPGTWTMEHVLLEVRSSYRLTSNDTRVDPSLDDVCDSRARSQVGLLFFPAGRTLQTLAWHRRASYGQMRSSAVCGPGRNSRRPNCACSS